MEYQRPIKRETEYVSTVGEIASAWLDRGTVLKVVKFEERII